MMADGNPARSEAIIATDKASRYLQQLCKHFAHKIEVSFDPQKGKISFPIGDCNLAASDTALHLTLQSPGNDELVRLQDVVERHLVRFAFRDELRLDWQPA